MAIENNDLMVLQKAGGGEPRKATFSALLNDVVLPGVPTELDDLSDVDTSTDEPTDGQILVYDTDKWVPGDPTVAATPGLQAVTDVGATTDKGIIALSFQAGSNVQANTEVTAGSGANQIQLNGTSGQIGGGADVYIDCGEYAT